MTNRIISFLLFLQFQIPAIVSSQEVGKDVVTIAVDGSNDFTRHPSKVEFSSALKRITVQISGVTNGATIDGLDPAPKAINNGSSITWDILDPSKHKGAVVIIADNSKKELYQFSISADEGSPKKETTGKPVAAPLDERKKFIDDYLIKGIKVTPYGFVIQGDSYLQGPNFVHLFFDRNGNSIGAVPPQGVSNLQYVVHILYVVGKGNPDMISYTVNQTAGVFMSSLNIKDAGGFKGFTPHSGELESKEEYREDTYLLSTSSNDIQFDILKIISAEDSVLKSYIIKMTPTYNATLEFGLLKSTLANPEFSFLMTESDTAKGTVLTKNNGDRGMTSLLATFYTSPIIIVRKYLLGNDIPNFQLTGRNFLYDHEFYERFYPTIGIGLNGAFLENLFTGITFELVRGGSLFFGWHFGRVNSFNATENMDYTSTPLTSQEFNARKQQTWRTSKVWGVTVDLLVLKEFLASK